MAPKWYEWPLYAFATHRQFRALAHSGTPNVSKNASPVTTINELESGRSEEEKRELEGRDPYLIDEKSSPEIDPKNWPTWKKVCSMFMHLIYLIYHLSGNNDHPIE